MLEAEFTFATVRYTASNATVAPYMAFAICTILTRIVFAGVVKALKIFWIADLPSGTSWLAACCCVPTIVTIVTTITVTRALLGFAAGAASARISDTSFKTFVADLVRSTTSIAGRGPRAVRASMFMSNTLFTLVANIRSICARIINTLGMASQRLFLLLIGSTLVGRVEATCKKAFLAATCREGRRGHDSAAATSGRHDNSKGEGTNGSQNDHDSNAMKVSRLGLLLWLVFGVW